MTAAKEPKNTFDPSFIRDVSERVYRTQLGADDALRMVDKDGDGGVKLRNRATSYDVLTRAYLAALGIRPSKPNDVPMALPEPAIADLADIIGVPV